MVANKTRSRSSARNTVAAAISNLRNPSSTLQAIRDLTLLTQEEVIDSYEPLLPLALRLQGQPYTLKDHEPFSPMYRMRPPRQLLMKTGRQCAKTTNLAGSTVMSSYAIPNFKTLHITPLFEQIRRFSSNVVRPFVETSPLKNLWRDPTIVGSVLQRSFNNQSLIIFSFSGLDCSRLRGIPTDQVCVDEIQDFDGQHWPIIESCMSASPYKIAKFCGTPKSKENIIEGFWQKSSQAEWVVKCQTGGCGKWNIPHIDHHLLKMIGPPHQHISERYPGTVCYSCRKPISPRHGHWLHAVPERRMTFAGYHVPQIILPMHFASYDDWTILHAKMNGAGNTSHAKFCNEILGESVDVGQKLVSMTELKKAGRLPWVNTPNNPDRQVYDRLKHYEHRVLGVDWGGGGDDAMSYTVFTLLGYKPGGHIDVLWGKRLPSSQEHVKEGAELKFWMERFGAHYIAHDYTGAGTVRETLIRQAGIPADRILSMQYVPAMAGNLIKYIPVSPVHTRPFYRLNKARSLLYTCNAIKFNMIDFFQWDGTGEANEGLMQDFLALTENKIETRVGDIYTITRNPLLIDDFSHAVNFGCAALWHMHDSWPDLSRVITMKDIDNQMQELIGDEHSWDNYKDEDEQSAYVEIYR